MPIKLNTASSGSVTLDAANTASNFTITVPATTATMAIDGPAFSAYTNANLSTSANVATKVLFQVEEYDTNNNFALSRFTPTVAGYYQLNTQLECAAGANNYAEVAFYKNGTVHAKGTNFPTSALAGPVLVGSVLVYFNGSTDYAEVYVISSAGITVNNISMTKFQGVLVRGA